MERRPKGIRSIVRINQWQHHIESNLVTIELFKSLSEAEAFVSVLSREGINAQIEGKPLVNIPGFAQSTDASHYSVIVNEADAENASKLKDNFDHLDSQNIIGSTELFVESRKDLYVLCAATTFLLYEVWIAVSPLVFPALNVKWDFWFAQRQYAWHLFINLTVIAVAIFRFATKYPASAFIPQKIDFKAGIPIGVFVFMVAYGTMYTTYWPVTDGLGHLFSKEWASGELINVEDYNTKLEFLTTALLETVAGVASAIVSVGLFFVQVAKYLKSIKLGATVTTVLVALPGAYFGASSIVFSAVIIIGLLATYVVYRRLSIVCIASATVSLINVCTRFDY